MPRCISKFVCAIATFVFVLAFQIKQTILNLKKVNNPFPVFSVIDEAPFTDTVESWDSVAWKAIDELRQSSFDQAKSKSACLSATHRVDVFHSLSQDRHFNCSYPPGLPPTYYCGRFSKYIHPYLWECRLKSRLFGYIDQLGLRNLGFTGIDVGVAFGDWLVAVGSYAPHSRLIGVEASREVHQEMIRQLSVNPHLSMDRIFVHHAAAVSKDAYEGIKLLWTQQRKNQTWRGQMHGIRDTNRALDRGILFDNQQKQWRGPSLCLKHNVKGDPGRTSVTETSHCDGDAVPAVALDWLLLGPHPHKDYSGSGNDNRYNDSKKAWQDGSLFFLKIDVEGGEFSALQGGDHLLTSLSNRPCIMFVELKSNRRLRKLYNEAFQLITRVYNYTDYEDIDAGIPGLDSYPPKGSMYENEGNYEFRLAPREFQQCVQRVLRAAVVESG